MADLLDPPADLVEAVAVALGRHDYPDSDDEVALPDRLAQARAVLLATREWTLANREMPAGPPVSVEHHLAESARVLAMCVEADGTPPLHEGDDETLAWRVQTLQVAEIHARIAHAAAAAGLIPPEFTVEAGPPAGLEALQKLAAAVERLAGEETR